MASGRSCGQGALSDEGVNNLLALRVMVGANGWIKSNESVAARAWYCGMGCCFEVAKLFVVGELTCGLVGIWG